MRLDLLCNFDGLFSVQILDWRKGDRHELSLRVDSENPLNRLQLQFFAALAMQKNKHRLALVMPIFAGRLKNLNHRFELAFMMIGERVEVIE